MNWACFRLLEVTAFTFLFINLLFTSNITWKARDFSFGVAVMNYQQHLANSAAIRAEIQRFESVHPNIYSIYELLERVEEPLLQNQIREHVIAIEGRTGGGCWLSGWLDGWQPCVILLCKQSVTLHLKTPKICTNPRLLMANSLLSVVVSLVRDVNSCFLSSKGWNLF